MLKYYSDELRLQRVNMYLKLMTTEFNCTLIYLFSSLLAILYEYIPTASEFFTVCMFKMSFYVEVSHTTLYLRFMFYTPYSHSCNVLLVRRPLLNANARVSVFVCISQPSYC
jgi:hypothetical protein